MVKTCGTCGVPQPLENFHRRAKAPDGHQSRCKACCRRWYAANGEHHRSRNGDARRSRKERRRQWMWDYFLEHPCIDCGEPDPIVLTFDHRDDEEKIGDVSAMLELSWDRLLAEIAKCDVRCANCHLRRTAVQFGWYATQVAKRGGEGTRTLTSPG